MGILGFGARAGRRRVPAWVWLGLLVLILVGGGVVAVARRPRLAPAPETPQPFGFGRAPTAEEIAAWDIDIDPEGVGLPAGQGTVADGAKIYAQRCARCHGRSGVEGPFDVLVGREPLARQEHPQKTIGNYWPYATTLYDYINRSMPYDRPGSLAPNEIYAVIAWLLNRNEIIRDDQVIDAATLPKIRMPAAKIFVPDPRSPKWVR